MDLSVNAELQEAPTLIQPEEPGKARVFHPLNSHPVAWESLLPAIVSTLSHSNARTNKINTVPFQAWLQKIRADAEAVGSADIEAMLKVNPAAKLLCSMRSLLRKARTWSLRHRRPRRLVRR